MSRKNSRAVKVRRHRRGEGRHPDARTHYPKLERMNAPDLIVRPVGMCGTKLKFATEADAATALTQAQAAHRGSGRVEKRYYGDCERNCGGWHLTSRAEWTPRQENR